MIHTYQDLAEWFTGCGWDQPGWRMNVYDGGYGAAMLVIQGGGAQDPLLAQVSYQTALPYQHGVTDEQMADMVRQAIHKAVCHEADRWLRLP